MIAALVLLSALTATAAAANCQLAPQSQITGQCTRSSQCTGPGTYWIASFSWGRRRSRGCETQPVGVRCCVRVGNTNNNNNNNNNNSPATTSTTTQVPATTTSIATGGGNNNNGATGVRAQYLAFHNDERSCYGIPALQWSNQLELSARVYASKCVFEHSTRAERNNAGENLAAGSGARDEISLLQGWLDEQFNWNCQTNQGSGVVGHYTQMVWSASRNLGCAAIVCNSNSPFGTRFGSRWTNVVCHYDPPGNFNGRNAITGQEPRGQCGTCARSVRTEDTTWGVKDEDDTLEVCVPQNAATMDGSELGSGKCVCPFDPTVEGPCIPDAETPCTNPPVTCADGTTLYPRQPECSVKCAESGDATMAVAGGAAAVTAAAILVL